MKLGTQTALLTISQYGCAPAMPDRKKFSIFGSNDNDEIEIKEKESANINQEPSQYLIEEIKAAIAEK